MHNIYNVEKILLHGDRWLDWGFKRRPHWRDDIEAEMWMKWGESLSTVKAFYAKGIMNAK